MAEKYSNMKLFLFEMEIVEKIGNSYKIHIFDANTSTTILFSPDIKTLEFLKDDWISRLLKENEYQYRKILHNKRRDTFFTGFKLKFSIQDKKNVAEFNDFSKIVVLDRRNGKFESYVIDKGLDEIYEIYTDGSFLQKLGKGASVVLIKNLKGDYKIFSYKTERKSSALIELIAVIKGLEISKNVEKIRIISDSLYVRKGPTEWLFNWKLNNWYTANGEKAKNIVFWKRIDKLTEGRYIEFMWVKGHSSHFENTLCDLYAKKIAKE